MDKINEIKASVPDRDQIIKEYKAKDLEIKSQIMNSEDEPTLFWFQQLTPSKLKSKHKIICVSGYMSKDSKDSGDWAKLIECFPSTEIFDLCWDSYSMSEMASEGMKHVGDLFTSFGENGYWRKFLKNPDLSDLLSAGITRTLTIKQEIWDKSYIEAEKTGRHLAKMLINKHFDDSQITLVGFSLGTVVIASCLKELNRLQHYGIIHDVLLMGGAASLKDFEELEVDQLVNRMINVISKNDSILTYVLKLARFDDLPIGLNEITLKTKSLKLINLDKSGFIKGHTYYRREIPAILKEIWLTEESFMIEKPK